MNERIGRNDPCPCGSGKKYKQCCLLKAKTPAGRKKIQAKVIKPQKSVDLMERTFGDAIEKASRDEKTAKEEGS
jgi:hypothetical protein